MSQQPNAAIQYAQLSDGIVIIRVRGRGSHQNAPQLRQVYQLTKDGNPALCYIFDMNECEAMDSTFMGTMASIAIHQSKQTSTSAIVINMREHVCSLLNTLGLKYILDMRSGKGVCSSKVGEEKFKTVETSQLSRLERTVIMIEAHERLVDIDSRNEVIFEDVIQALKESLDRVPHNP
jgi:anti-anti-sigma regulatory factor